jgi:hypothetical protein
MSSSLEPEHLRRDHTTACLERRSPYPESRHGASLPIQCEQDTDRDAKTQSCLEEENMMDELRVGDHLSVDLLGLTSTECPSMTIQPGFEASCVLDRGHAGRHVSADAAMVVTAVWD